MPDITAQSSVAVSIQQRAEVIERDLNHRLQAVLPEMVDVEGRVDWRTLGHMQLERQMGSVVMAYALPELLTDTSREVSYLEAAGRLDEALQAYETAEHIGRAANQILQVASELVYTPTSIPGHTFRTRQGEVVNQGASLSKLADVLVLRMQESSVTPETASTFIDSTVRPVVELMRQRFEADTALAIVDMAAVLDYDPDDIVAAAAEYHFDLCDEGDRGRLTFAVKQAGSIEMLADMKKVHGYIDIDDEEDEDNETRGSRDEDENRKDEDKDEDGENAQPDVVSELAALGPRIREAFNGLVDEEDEEAEDWDEKEIYGAAE